MVRSPSRRRIAPLVIRLSATAALVLGCACSDPAGLKNHNPEVLSVELFPSAIAIGDSAMAYTRAFDPDGDSLFYDWTTDGRLTLKGVPPFFHALYDSRSATQIFYAATLQGSVDTAWIEAAVRDHRGGFASVLVPLTLHQ